MWKYFAEIPALQAKGMKPYEIVEIFRQRHGIKRFRLKKVKSKKQSASFNKLKAYFWRFVFGAVE